MGWIPHRSESKHSIFEYIHLVFRLKHIPIEETQWENFGIVYLFVVAQQNTILIFKGGEILLLTTGELRAHLPTPWVYTRLGKAGLFFVHFQKTQGPKNSTSKKTQGHFLPKNSICRDFLRLHIKNSMQMTSISIHFLKQMVSIDNYKEDNFFPAINKWIITTQPT